MQDVYTRVSVNNYTNKQTMILSSNILENIVKFTECNSALTAFMRIVHE